MSNKLVQNRIHELAKSLEKKEIKLSDIEDKETRDMIIWYLRVDKGNSMVDIAILLEWVPYMLFRVKREYLARL